MNITPRLISVIVPCYNQAAFLSEALTSVLQQTYTQWECIIVNDGSPDETSTVALQFCTMDKRFIYVQKENGGLSSARNVGLQKATGEYIQFLDSDDTLYRTKFEEQIGVLQQGADIVISDYFPFDAATGTFLSRRYLSPFADTANFKYDIVLHWENRLSIPCHCVLFRKKLLQQKDGFLNFDETLENHEDWLFWTQVFYRAHKIEHYYFTHANYRIHNKSMCHNNALMQSGFEKACIKVKNFFAAENDVTGVKVAQIKHRSITGKETVLSWSILRYMKLFIPPIFYKVKFLLK